MLATMPRQREDESVSSFGAQYLRVAKLYGKFVGAEPEATSFFIKLKPRLQDALAATDYKDDFEQLLKVASHSINTIKN